MINTSFFLSHELLPKSEIKNNTNIFVICVRDPEKSDLWRSEVAESQLHRYNMGTTPSEYWG